MRKPVALITGVLGFAGSHLADELLAHGYEVVGNRFGKEPLTNVDHIKNRIRLFSLDILNSKKCVQMVRKYKPDYVFHLAAMASVGKSFSMEQLTFAVNVEGTMNMLDAAREYGKLRKFIFVGSADCYGRFKPANKTLKEDQPLNPISPYSIAKSAAERMSLYYHRQYDVPVCVARSFTHAGPRQADSFVISAFSKQVAMIEAGLQKPVMKVGDLTAKRDFSDVRDVVRGYRLMAEKGRIGEIYHLSTGKAVAVQKVLDTLLSRTEKKITVRTDKARLRKADIPVLRGDNSKAVKQLGFTLDIGLKQTVHDTLDYWRTKVRRK